MDFSQIGYCGYNCGICAGRSEDIAERRKMVEGWKKLYGHKMYTEDNVPIARPCCGCRNEGEMADTSCQVRPCAKSKGVESCADCSDFPCDKIQNLLGEENSLLIFCCRNKEVTREEFEMSARQFCSMPTLVERLKSTGKLPNWDEDKL